MSIQNISPSLQAYINNPKPKQETAVVSNSIEKTDTFTPSNTNEVKEANGIIDKIKNMPTIGKVIGGIAVTCIAIGGACLIFKGKGDKVQGVLDQAKGAQETAEKIQQDGQKAYDEIMEIIRQGQEKGFCDLVQDGKTIKFMSEGEGKLPSTIEEYIGETVSRKSSLIETDGKLVPKTIEEFIEGTKKKNQYIFKGDSVSEFYKGYEEGADGAKKWAEGYIWVDGKFIGFAKSGEESADGAGKIAELYIWDDGKLSGYGKGSEEGADETVKCAEVYILDDGKLTNYMKGFETSADGTKWAEWYQLGDDGKLHKCKCPKRKAD